MVAESGSSMMAGIFTGNTGKKGGRSRTSHLDDDHEEKPPLTTYPYSISNTFFGFEPSWRLCCEYI
jgi:hypothetical protein